MIKSLCNLISIGLSCQLDRPDFWIVHVYNKNQSPRTVRVRSTVWEIGSHHQDLHHSTDEPARIARQMTISSCSINRCETRWFKMYTIANNNCWHCAVYCKMWVNPGTTPHSKYVDDLLNCLHSRRTPFTQLIRPMVTSSMHPTATLTACWPMLSTKNVIIVHHLSLMIRSTM